MESGEIFWRARNFILQRAWRWRAGANWRLPRVAATRTTLTCPPPLADGEAKDALVRAAEEVLAGNWQVFGTPMVLPVTAPDWHRDPLTGRRVVPHYFTKIRYRDEASVGNIKFLWELSRLHHVTLLASAYHASGNSIFAARAFRDLESWWNDNPPLYGVHWVSGIEMGVRLLAWCWCRRLLAAHPDVVSVFEGNDCFLRQLHAHQTWIVAFRSRASSANNHLIAELTGLLAAALAFPCFPESGRWATMAVSLIEKEAKRQTFRDGVNRELASDYQVFVLELLLSAGVEADAGKQPLSDRFWGQVRAMADALAAMVDSRFAIPRQGDGDEGRALMFDAPELRSSTVLLDTCDRLFGAAAWWPAIPQQSVAAMLFTSVACDHRGLKGERPADRPSEFVESGISILRDHSNETHEIWCRIDHGPHGFLSIAAHAHADALSIEVREDGHEILVDPGTYCYHGEPVWRDYFRSTIGHNTLEIQNTEQSVAAGPFLWATQATGRLDKVSPVADRDVDVVVACHDGYARLAGQPVHHRSVRLDRIRRCLRIHDWIEGHNCHEVRLVFHLHPSVNCSLGPTDARLSWTTHSGPRHAALHLPTSLKWVSYNGNMDPILGWYSPGFGRRISSTTLVGSGTIRAEDRIESCLVFLGLHQTSSAEDKVRQTLKWN